MKKFLLSAMLLIATNIATINAEDIILNPTLHHEVGTKPRSPIAPIYVDQDGYTLSFDESCIGCSVTLIDDEDNIVYTDIVDENGIVELPNNLSGTYELQIERGSIIFVGEISL